MLVSSWMRISLLLIVLLSIWKGGDFNKKTISYQFHSLHDASSKTNILCALDFKGNKLFNLKAMNNQQCAQFF